MRKLKIDSTLIVLTAVLVGIFSSSNSVLANAPTAIIAPSIGDTMISNNDSTSSGNFFSQLFSYFKDSMVRTVDGTKEMWINHGRCNQIRAKQKEYREKLQKQWEFEEQGLTPKEMKQRLSNINGGITYDEFVFLMKGKEDRGKLMNLVFIGWAAPRFFPYALMFNPNMLPGPLAPLHNVSGRESKLEKLSRERGHAVIGTLLAIEDEAKIVPALAKLNIFANKKQARKMDFMDSLGKSIRQIMAAPETESNDDVASIVMNTMEETLYSPKVMTRAQKRLCFVPKCVINGILTTIDGPNLTIVPSFVKRGKILNHIQKLNEIDNFLVNENISLEELSTARLLEACSDRMIVGPGQTDDERRKYLKTWLDLAVNEPMKRIEKTGEHFNTNLAKTILMGYYSVNGARDDRSASYLPRELFSAQTRSNEKD